MLTQNKMYKGLFWGLITGIVDVLPMLYQRLPWDAILSAFSFWIIAGFVISTSTLHLNKMIKGSVLAFILIIPVGVLIAWNSLVRCILVCIMTLLLGSVLGYLIERNN